MNDKYSFFDKFDRGIGSIILAILIAGARSLLKPEKNLVQRALVFFGSVTLSVGVGFIVHQSGGWISKFDYVAVALCAYAGKEVTSELPAKIPGFIYDVLSMMIHRRDTDKTTKDDTNKSDDISDS